ncbi:hypothetical protein LguiA_022192 [Lonicera macranthoides]
MEVRMVVRDGGAPESFVGDDGGAILGICGLKVLGDFGDDWRWRWRICGRKDFGFVKVNLGGSEGGGDRKWGLGSVKTHVDRYLKVSVVKGSWAT